MAAAHTLPPIQGAQGMKGGVSPGMVGSMKHSQPVHFAPAPPRGPPSGRLKPIKIKSKYVEKEQGAGTFVSQQPLLTKRQTTAYRNTYKHNLCVDMLQNGFHLSFCELFALIKQQEDSRANAGPESLMWTMTLLKDQHEKLDMLKLHLTRAETAHRRGDFQDVYRARFELARYFQSVGDKWLSDHFFNTCLQTSNQVSGDGGKMQAEGFCNVALAEEENNDYYEAAENFEAYYRLACENKDWTTADGITYYTDACINLSRIYTTIGERVEAESQEQMLDYLTKAYDKAKESHQQKLEGEAAYRLGLASDKTGHGETALVHLNTYLSICRSTDDKEGIGQACDAIAKAFARQTEKTQISQLLQELSHLGLLCLQREGKVEESIEYLKQFVDVAEKSGQEHAYSKACHNLGNIYNTLGRYDEATKYFDKAYNLARSMGETDSINVNRVQYGVAMAHKMLNSLGKHITLNSMPAVERLIEWKSSRMDEFDKPFPEPRIATPVPTPQAEVPAPVEESAPVVSEAPETGNMSPRAREDTTTSTAETATTNQEE